MVGERPHGRVKREDPIPGHLKIDAVDDIAVFVDLVRLALYQRSWVCTVLYSTVPAIPKEDLDNRVEYCCRGVLPAW